MKTILCWATAAAATVLLTTGASAVVVDKDIHHTFDVTEGAVLKLDHGDGDVTITPWDKDVIDVAVRYHGDVKALGIGVKPGFTVYFDQQDGVVTVRGEEGSATGVFIVTSISDYQYTYTIQAPDYVVIRSTGDDGDISISGWRADLDCELEDGDIDLSDIVNETTQLSIDDGDIRIENATTDLSVTGYDGNTTVMGSDLKSAFFSMDDGDVRVLDSKGDFDVSVEDGDTRFARVAAGALDVRGEDGDVDLDLTGSGQVNVSVVVDDGDVSINVPRDLSFKYLVTVEDGAITVGLPNAAVTETSDRKAAGSAGSGEGMIRVRTSGGDVILSSGS